MTNNNIILVPRDTVGVKELCDMSVAKETIQQKLKDIQDRLFTK